MENNKQMELYSPWCMENNITQCNTAAFVYYFPYTHLIQLHLFVIYHAHIYRGIQLHLFVMFYAPMEYMITSHKWSCITQGVWKITNKWSCILHGVWKITNKWSCIPWVYGK
jgi:hypothetical protein